MKLKGITFFTRNVKETVKFYKDALGANPIKESEKTALFGLGDLHILIHETHESSTDKPPSEDHIEFEVDDINQACMDLQGKGYSIEIEPKKYYWGISAYLRDPDNRLIELHENK